VPSNHSVDDTVGKLKTILQAKGITLFALIDHSGEAEKVGMKMLPTRLLIFGNPKSGTPIMLGRRQAVRSNLPLKILVWKMIAGKSGSPTTVRNIYSNGTACRSNSCRTFLLWRLWQPKQMNNRRHSKNQSVLGANNWAHTTGRLHNHLCRQHFFRRARRGRRR